MFKKIAFGSLAVAPTLALADVTAALAEITAAGTDGAAVAAGLLTLAVSIWGALYIKRKFFGG